MIAFLCGPPWVFRCDRLEVWLQQFAQGNATAWAKELESQRTWLSAPSADLHSIIISVVFSSPALIDRFTFNICTSLNTWKDKPVKWAVFLFQQTQMSQMTPQSNTFPWVNTQENARNKPVGEKGNKMSWCNLQPSICYKASLCWTREYGLARAWSSHNSSSVVLFLESQAQNLTCWPRWRPITIRHKSVYYIACHCSNPRQISEKTMTFARVF